jgi:hypothetical protein
MSFTMGCGVFVLLDALMLLGLAYVSITSRPKESALCVVQLLSAAFCFATAAMLMRMP